MDHQLISRAVGTAAFNRPDKPLESVLFVHRELLTVGAKSVSGQESVSDTIDR
jgi:hypothetical protein